MGRDAAGGAHLLRYDGLTWGESRPPRGVAFTEVVAGGRETWLTGARDGAQALLRRDGGDWRDAPVPPGAVYGLHILAADDVWAAGATDSGAAVAHRDGQAWRQTIVDGFPRSAVGTVPAVSPTEVWAGGTAGFVGGPVGRPIPPLLVRRDGQGWNRVTVPADFGSVTSLPPTAPGSPAWVSVARSRSGDCRAALPRLSPGRTSLPGTGGRSPSTSNRRWPGKATPRCSG
ncbi:hypothetical protein ACWCQ0_42570 [Streptomyces massasporeus]|uniref:hypothetical protein n=1 Tax=Streptomyces massasporeus TaxID=67324 RepID=UPI0033D62D6E